MSLSSDVWLGTYDDMSDLDLYTNNFTKLDGIEIIKSDSTEDHSFLHFLRGFSHGVFDYEIKHGWFHTDTKNAKFYIRGLTSKVGGMITHAWKEYVSDPDVDVTIYTSYCGQLYAANDFDTDVTFFYKQLASKIIEKI